MGEVILEARKITKVFPGVKALDKVDFDLRSGEVHILVGENGAGKSTLAKVILGVYQQDNGEILLDNQKIELKSTIEGLENGIVAVYQEFTLVPHLSVAQNIFLNREYKNKFGLIDHARMEKEAREILKTLNCNYIDVKEEVVHLSVAGQQMVEIAKALSFNPRIIVFDEPTSALSEREVDSLFDQIHKLKKAGLGIIYVSHRMQEFPLIGDRITILRDGQKIGTVDINEKSNEELVNMMVGREVSQVYNRKPEYLGEEVLRLDNVSDKQGRVKDVSLTLKKGEIVGLVGLVGSGRTELAELIFGINPMAKGEMYLYGEKITPQSPVEMVKKGIGLITEDRKKFGLALKDAIAWNVVGVSLKKYFSNNIVSYARVCQISEEYRKILRISTSDVHKECGLLSGGNQQKVVLAKWLASDVEIIIFDEPTRGIDVGAKMEIYTLMNNLANEGKAIIIISSELPEVIGMSDRLYIMKEGRFVKRCKKNELTSDEIGAEMLGVGGMSCEII